MTLADRSSCELLTDELSLVRVIDGRWRAFGTPFWGDVRVSGRNASFPLRKICFIQKADAHSVLPLERAGFLRKLARNVIFFQERSVMDRAMRLSWELAHAVEACEVQFQMNAGFWEFI